MGNNNKKSKLMQCPFLYWGMLLCGTFFILMFLSFKVSIVKSEPIFSVFILGEYKLDLLYTMAAFGVFFILNKIKDIFSVKLGFLKLVGTLFLSAFFSLFSLLSLYFNKTDVSLIRILRNFESFLAFSVAFIGGIIFFSIIFLTICYVGENYVVVKGIQKSSVLERFFGKHLFRNSMIAMAICWLPQYIIRFPGVVPYDVWQSIAMHLGYTEITTQHPLIWGVMVGELVELGAKIGIGWLAPLVICFVQHILSMLMVAYTVHTLKKFKFSTWVLGLVIVFFGVFPPIALYASTMYNDCFYSLSIMLLLTELAYYLYDRKEFFGKKHHIVLTIVAVLGTGYRYNGLYTVAALIAAIAIWELYLLIKHREKFMRTVIILVLCTIIPLFSVQLIQGSLNDRFDAREIRSRAMLAMPIQQSVRCLITHGDEIPQEDYDALHAVLTWSDEMYEKKYDPKNFDGVKESFKIEATGEEMSGFIKAWINLVLRYPYTCFMATADQTYYIFSPFVKNVRYYESNSAHIDKALERYDFDATPYVFVDETLETLCSELRIFYANVFPGIPVFGLTVNSAVYTILLIGICFCLLFSKDKRALVLAVPLLITLAITFLGPAVYRHPRYVYPIMYSMPLFLSCFVMQKKLDKEV